MKLLRIGDAGRERPALLDAQYGLRDLSAVIPDIAGDVLCDETLNRLRRIDIEKLPSLRGGARIGACVGGTHNFIAVGLNYVDHAEESKMSLPSEPVLFNKAPSCAVGPNDDVVIPSGAQKLDWEVELAVVIGKRAYQVPKEEAISFVSGYCVCNDISERSFQLEGTGQWLKGKSCPTFGPLGPWLVTRDEIENPQNLDLWLDLNGRRMQAGHTSKMVFSVGYLVSYISRFMVLEPGDVITTGTPPGVGFGMVPQLYLKTGDEIVLGVEGLGVQRAKVVSTEA